VIDPNAIPIPDVHPEDVDTAGRAIKTDGTNIAQTGHDIDSDWQGLKQFYHSPEAASLFAKTKPVAAAGDSMKAPTHTAGDALVTFAETAKTLVADLKGLKSKAEAFRKKIDGDDDWREDEDKVKEHNNLNNDILGKLVAYQAAERDCANKITGLFGGTHFIGGDPTADKVLLRNGEQIYGLSKAINDIETPWAKPQKYDAPWYEDVWNGIKDFGVGIVQDLASLVGLYGAEGWGWKGWDNLGANWDALAGGIAGLVGFHGPDGWGWKGWGNLGDNWLNLVNGFVPYREWDGGNGAGYVITQSILNIGSCFVGAGVVKGLMKAGKAGRTLEAVEGASTAAKVSILGREFMSGFKSAFKLPSLADLKSSLDNIKLKVGDLTGLGKTLDDADKFHTPDTDLNDPNITERDPVHVGGDDHPGDHGGTGDHGGNDGGGGHDDGGGKDGSGNDGGGNDGHTDPKDGHTDPNGGHTDPNQGHDPNKGHDPNTPDPEEAKKLGKANDLEQGLRDGGLTDEQIERLRGDLPRDSRQWLRIGSALSQKFSGKIQDIAHPKAVDFAFDEGRVTNPETFAQRYEYFKARFDVLRDQIRDQVTDKTLKLVNKSPAQEALERLNPTDLRAQLKADIDQVHAIRPHPASVDPHLSGPDLDGAVRAKAGDIDMGSDTSAAYHVIKHLKDIVPDEVTGNPTRDYFNSAERTIHDGDIVDRLPADGGGQELIFRRQVMDGVGKPKLMQAIVLEKPDGRLILKTYGVAKAKLK
jgi:hypothetical protein